MTIYDLPSTLPWAKLLKDYNFMSYFTKLLVPGMTQDDFILEIIMLIGAMATDVNVCAFLNLFLNETIFQCSICDVHYLSQACSILATGNLISSLYSLFQDKQADAEIMLQLLNCFHKYVDELNKN